MKQCHKLYWKILTKCLPHASVAGKTVVATVRGSVEFDGYTVDFTIENTGTDVVEIVDPDQQKKKG